MRDITANAQTYLNQNTGTEIMALLEVEWVEGGSVFYSDQDITGAKTSVISLGGFDTSMMLEGAAASQQLSVVLDDTDGAIKNIYNNNDIHKRPVKLYLLHKGLPLSDKILVFKGVLATPIAWDEAQRSVSFDVLSRLDSKQVGFSMEEGDFPNIPDEALGKAWPLVFGQVCHLPAVKVRAPRRGYLESGTGIHDFTLEPRICQAKKIQCPGQVYGSRTVISRAVNNEWGSENREQSGPDFECVNRRYGEVCRLHDLLEQQVAYEYDSFEVYNGSEFPQGQEITLSVDGALFRGSFSGNTFTITWRQHPDFADFNHIPCRNVPPIKFDRSLDLIEFLESREARWVYAGHIGMGVSTLRVTWFDPDEAIEILKKKREAAGNFIYKFSDGFENCEEALQLPNGPTSGGPRESQEYYDEMEAANFFWAPAGSEVYIESESEILYIVSLIPGTVDSVAAYRTAPNGFRYLTEVPTDYYTVYETDYGAYTVIEIRMDKELSFRDNSWENQIYVSFTSDVGPNPCDIIEWLVDKYTDLTIDSSSFTNVKSYLTNYPSNFYFVDRPDVYNLIQDIAYQSRCAIYIRNDIVYIRYLSLEPTSERTIDEGDILSGSFIEFLSETEDVYTTHKIDWKVSGATVRDDKDSERTLVLKYNVNKYGSVEESWKYFTHNIYSLVLKTGTFWLIRKANSWKKVSFKLPIKHIDLDVGDGITLDVDQFSTSNIKVVIESMNLNIDDYTIDVVCWTPIRSGETSAYYWAWPSQQSQYQIWPLSGDNNGGGGYDFDVTPPIGHILTGGAHRDDQLIITSGDLHPSDLDDSLPTITCEISDYWDFDEEEPEIIAKEIAQLAARQNMDQAIEEGVSASLNWPDEDEDEISEEEDLDEPEEEDEAEYGCGEGPEGGCYYEVELLYLRCTSTGQPECGGPCTHNEPGCGCCNGDFRRECHTFSDPQSALAFYNMQLSELKSTSGEWWEIQEEAIVSVWIRNGDQVEDCTHYQNAETPDLSQSFALNRVSTVNST